MGLMVQSLAGISFATIAAIVGVVVYLIVSPPPDVPQLEDTWWGPGSPKEQAPNITPFKINVPENVLQDLRYRLDHAITLQEPLEGAKHHYGLNTNLLKEIVEFWKTKYDWKKRETFLNKFPQYTMNIQGLNVHYIHVKPQNTKGLRVLPLLLVHGWPGSVREFYDIIPMLTKPAKGRDYVFEVIVPSLPGYGFSEGAARPGLGAAQMAVVFKNLMQNLGFEKYYIQGGDWGSVITLQMSILYPEKVLGYHSNMCYVNTALSNLKMFLGAILPRAMVTAEEEPWIYPLSEKFSYLVLETGYMHLQSTKPDTVGVALRDSPVGLAAYILEKFITWTNPAYRNTDNGSLAEKYGYEALLDNIMIYWVTRSFTTSARLYAETFNSAHRSLNLESIPVKVPTACARFTYDLAYAPKNILKDKFVNLVQLTHHVGGHFAAFELPEVLANDIWQFVDAVERDKKSPKK